MIEVDPQNPDLRLFAGARSYRSQDAVTAVRLTEPIVVVHLLGRDEGQPGDYLVRDRSTGRASLVPKATFEKTYFIDRELDGSTAKPTKRTVIV